MNNIIEIKLIITNQCNLNCKYCLIQKNKHTISNKTIINSLNFISKNVVNDNNTIVFDLFGGEPLLYINKILYCAKKIKQKFKNYKICITTNGVLLDQKTILKLKQNNISFAISLDGPEKINEIMRCNAKQYAKIISNIKLVKKNNLPLIIGCTLGNHNINKPKTLINFFKKMGVDLLSFNLLIGDTSNPAYVEPIKYATQISKIYKEVIRANIPETTLNKLSNSIKNKDEYYCLACGKKYVINFDGNIYSCQAAIDNPEFKIGNIYKNIPIKKNKFANRKISNLEKCKKCRIKFFCRGGCLINSYLVNRTLEPSKETCLFYKELYKKMAREKL